jgi:hypothetical protein
MLGLTAACGGDQPLAPTAGPVAGPTAGGAAVTRSGVELLVLVDEAGQPHRVLIVRDERDPRVRELARLGYRMLSPREGKGDEVATDTRAIFAAVAAKGVVVSFYRSPGDGRYALLDSSIVRHVGKEAARRRVASMRTEDGTLERALATADSMLADVEGKMQLLLSRRGSIQSGSQEWSAEWSADSDTTRSTSGSPCSAARSSRDAATVAYAVAAMDFANRLRTAPRSPPVIAAIILWSGTSVAVAWWQAEAAQEAYDECMAAVRR